MDRCVGLGEGRNMCKFYWGNEKGRNCLADLGEKWEDNNGMED